MLKIFNFLKKETGEVKLVTMRERFEAAQSEINAVLADMAEMPAITVDAHARRIEIAAPEHFADEALALPAPEPEVESTSSDEEPTDVKADNAASNDDAEAKDAQSEKPAI
ncbi:hypothetical protein [Planktotalea sp.]|uniref:hypothetical protein n=1 Tax=Planktotalea sp. TaxID=2029877 RepID=UPI0035C7CDDB